MTDRRGRCDTCGMRLRLRRDGTVAGHPDRNPTTPPRAACPGSGKLARPLRFDPKGHPDCGECLMYLYGRQSAVLAEAIASVAIENGRDPGQMLRDFLGRYHDRDHKELDRS